MMEFDDTRSIRAANVEPIPLSNAFIHRNFCNEHAKKSVIEPPAAVRIAYVNTTRAMAKAETAGMGEDSEGGKPVWVQCPGYRCLAYQDLQGKWRTFFRGEILSNAISMAETMWP